MANLKDKLWYVFRVHEERQPDEICVTQDINYALGHSELLGIFTGKREATKFAAKHAPVTVETKK
jgi:hypothetical protein